MKRNARQIIMKSNVSIYGAHTKIKLMINVPHIMIFRFQSCSWLILRLAPMHISFLPIPVQRTKHLDLEIGVCCGETPTAFSFCLCSFFSSLSQSLALLCFAQSRCQRFSAFIANELIFWSVFVLSM